MMQTRQKILQPVQLLEVLNIMKIQILYFGERLSTSEFIFDSQNKKNANSLFGFDLIVIHCLHHCHHLS